MRSKKTHKNIIERNLLIIDLACKAGLRRSDISNLKVKDIDLKRNYLIVRQGKGMKDRIIDLTPSLHRSLEVYLKGKSPEEEVFGLAPNTISGIIRWAAKKAGIDIHTHSLRHFFGQSLVDSGTDLETVRRLMGHSSLRTTQVYIGRTDKQQKEAVERLEKPVDKEPVDDIKVQPATIFVEQPEDLYEIIKELKSFTLSLGGTGFNTISAMQKLWQGFERGMSRNGVVEALTKIYLSVNPGQEYFDAADALLGELSLFSIIRSTQRRIAYVHNREDVTYWEPTDTGRRVMRCLKRENIS